METLARNRHSSLEMICPSLRYQDIDKSRGGRQHPISQLERRSPVSILTSLIFIISEKSQYYKALQSYERQEKQQALSLVCATRQSLIIEEQLANQRLKE